MFWLAVGWAQAQTRGLEPPAGGPLPVWEAGIGGVAVSGPAYPGAKERVSRVLPFPWLIYRSPRLRADGSSVEARLFKSDVAELDLGFAGSLNARSDDVKVRQGMPNLGFQFEAGPRLKLKLTEWGPGERLRAELPLRAVIEAQAGLHPRGYTFSPTVIYERRWSPQLSLGTSVGLLWGDQRYANFLYGVPAEFARPDRPAYQAQAGLVALRVGAGVSYRLNPDWRVSSFVRYDDTRASANRDSPLITSRGGATVGMALTWTLGRSSARTTDMSGE